MRLEKYSFGVGDRFGRQGKAQLQALIKAKEDGFNIVPVWNKSHREHDIIKTSPTAVRQEADQAVQSLGWQDSYYIDADHINAGNVESFIEPSNFFTLDVADYIGQEADQEMIAGFVDRNKKYIGSLKLPALEDTFEITEELITQTAKKYLQAIKEAGKLYGHIESVKGKDNFITEVSMDETDQPQTPIELFFILSAISREQIPAQTIAPKFTGRFNKGVDYAGDVQQFAREFEADLAVIARANEEFDLPDNLKLSIHSGSDKFSIYKPINKAIKKFDAGLHLKTAGTTWLEELIGLALAKGEGLKIAKEVYKTALNRFDELCGPYSTVIDINKDHLPTAEEVDGWSSEEYASSLIHDLSCDTYNLNFRQLLHVGYKIAAEMGQDYLDALVKFEDIIAENVTENIYQRHIKRVFI